MRFEAKSPTSALLILEWYAYPVAEGVSSETKLKDNIQIPDDITVLAGKECLTAGRSLRDKIPCAANLKFASGARDLPLIANVTHGTASAYLPPRRVLVSDREPFLRWKMCGIVAIAAIAHAPALAETPDLLANPTVQTNCGAPPDLGGKLPLLLIDLAPLHCAGPFVFGAVG
jgi:hypothetical protein